MQIELTPSLEAYIQRKIESGEFTSAGEVLDELVRLAEEQEDERRMDELFGEAIAQYRRGETVPASEVTIERIKERVAEVGRRSGVPIDDDVTW